MRFAFHGKRFDAHGKRLEVNGIRIEAHGMDVAEDWKLPAGSSPICL
jgi:hypothetical protein